VAGGDLESRLRRLARLAEYDEDAWAMCEAADAIGEARRALLEAREKIAGLTPMGSSSSGVELSGIQGTIADDCDRVRGVIRGALAKLGGGEHGSG
jgi:hypothetical protein